MWNCVAKIKYDEEAHLYATVAPSGIMTTSIFLMRQVLSIQVEMRAA